MPLENHMMCSVIFALLTSGHVLLNACTICTL